ncbi:hypothetical protein PROFUN_09943 [Planoprotostelium fungivorum]|uniref:EGF-like domain-containing protein n=1 Tax=Planoprotostelium fungivorum TaxID=1890364 RepID=A0A2P6NGD6_9EUKA|nr:hypothetical protein PROFUN_09943 [Planoprotostelium fungivorum]
MLSKFGGVSVPGSHADRNMRLIGQLLILCIFFHTFYGFPNKISRRLEAFVTRASDDDVQPVWVHFKDKPSVTKAPHIDEKTLSRRELHGEPRWSLEDLPINVEYKEQVRSTVEEYGGHLRTISDFHNAVSASANRGAIAALANLSFVTSLDIVERISSDRKVGPDDKPSRKRTDYGKSLNEWNTTSATVLTDLGLDGSGVRVLVIDSGFYLAHECFNNISVHNEYDFIHNDTRVGNKPDDDATQDDHGTAVLSVIAGYTPGKMRGPAPAAEYLLAKTEKVGSDFPLEEDWFSAAVVWGELRGADIFSISIGYYSFYNWTQFDGQTARTTQAINRAVQKGVVVVMAVGNRGADGISPPSDAALTIGVGAVDATGTVASFSSIGPTADGRIKPDVSAVGVDVYSASTSTPTSYVMEDGTSVSAPYVAGVAACLKQYHPEWTNIQIREALMRSASSASSPDVRIGWGAINVQKALNYTPSASFCPNNCSGHGNCTSKGACQCETGFYDFDCSVATVQCADYCDTKGGYCTENSFVCQCKPSYSGVDCSIYGGDRFYIWQTLVSLALFVIIITAILIFTRNATLEGNRKYVRFAVYLVIAISIPLLDIGISEGLLHSAYVFTLELVWDVMDFVWKIYTAIILFRGWVPKYLNWSISVVGSLIHIVLTLPYSFYVYNSTASSGPGVVANLVKTAGLLLNDYVLLPISLYFIIRRIQGAFETADLQLTAIDGKRPESANSNAFHLTEEERAQPEEIRRDKVTDGETKVWYATHIVILLFIVFRLCEAGMSLKTTYYNQPYSTALLVAMIPMIGIFVTEKNIHYSRSFPHFYYYLFLIGAYVYVPVEVIAQLYVQAGGSAGLGFALQVGQSILMFFVTFFMKNAAKSMSYKYKYFHFVFRFQFFEEFLAFLLFLRKEVTGLLFWLSIIFQGLWTIYRNSGMLGKTIAWAWNNFKVKVGMATQTSVFGIDPEEGDKLTESVVLAQQYIVADIVAVIAIPAQFYTLYTIDSDYSRRLGINHAANVWQTYFVIGTVKAFSHVVVYALLRWRLQSYEYHRQLLRYSEDEDKERVKWTPLPSFSQMFLRQLYFYSLFFTVISFVSTRDAFSAASALFSTQG